ncbi:MAG: hypothetical protein Ct9H300mP4_10420 [Gammaproteobacteria bacterium]|nr:MAG: hypothetical protein Ct9H300mP4_10420 [Gammaproteobacteria bacterium]
MGDVLFSEPFNHKAVNQDIENFFRKIHEAGVLPISAGGDHSITYPIFKGIVTGQPIGMVHVDAHTILG